jgi:hypothetical protein
MGAKPPPQHENSSFDRLTNVCNVLNLKEMMTAISDQRVNPMRQRQE